MFRLVSGVFQDRQGADAAVAALVGAGIPAERIALIVRDAEGAVPFHPDATDSPEVKAEIGAAVGAGAGLLAGLAMVAIPGVGPVIGAGWIATALAAALTGGFAGGTVAAFMSGGLTQEEAHAYTEALMGGMNIVAVKADDRERQSVETIFRRHNAGDLEARAAAYETERSVIDRASPSWRT